MTAGTLKNSFKSALDNVRTGANLDLGKGLTSTLMGHLSLVAGSIHAAHYYQTANEPRFAGLALMQVGLSVLLYGLAGKTAAKSSAPNGMTFG